MDLCEYGCKGKGCAYNSHPVFSKLPCPYQPPSPPLAPGALCSNTCDFRSDGSCDDGGDGSSFGYCELGTDCDDCGSRTAPPPPPLSSAPMAPATTVATERASPSATPAPTATIAATASRLHLLRARHRRHHQALRRRRHRRPHHRRRRRRRRRRCPATACP